MKNLNTKKTKYEQIAEILERDGYVSDSQLFKIWGGETGIYNAQEHIRKWKKLKRERTFFADKKIIEKTKGYRCHLVRIEGQEEGEYYNVGKEFFNSLDIKR